MPSFSLVQQFTYLQTELSANLRLYGGWLNYLAWRLFRAPNGVSPKTQAAKSPLPIEGADPFLLYEQNRRFLSERTAPLHTPVETFKNLMIGVALITLILLTLLGANTWRWWQFTTNGVITEAKVIDTGGDSNSYHLIYTYHAPLADQTRQSLTGRDQVSYTTYRQHEPNTYLVVRYLKDDPEQVTSKWHRWWIWQLAAGYAVTLYLLWLALFSLPSHYRRRLQTILTQGRVLNGRILTSSGKGDDDGYKVTVSFEFTAPTGQLLKGSNAEIRNDLKQKELPSVGTPVAVLYLAEKDFFLL